MGNENQNKATETASHIREPKKSMILSISVLVSAAVLSGALVYTTDPRTVSTPQDASVVDSHTARVASREEEVLPSNGVLLPVTWGDLGAKLVSVGAIDADAFMAVYSQRGEFSGEYKELLFGNTTGKMRVTKDNAGYLLNLLWALGLANKNPILENGEMADPRYGGAGNFASTGGWTIARGDPMEHYSRHKFFALTDEEQALVRTVSRGIYRPCCGNSTHFPDCNHGMAMLGLLELMASQGASEEEMYQAALAVNSYWFPDTYLAIAQHFENRGTNWSEVSAKEVLGSAYSSASGYQRIRAEIETPQIQDGGGGGCGV
ncbi:MAG: hypothetical protein A3D67_01170 [Candidatus Lloydbacteria bacterium RIFCSPHIGHO2_02_FULL_51_22]|uniref:Uncharacterized protein n=3 Tax=Candidatus Lloydiibacteriota TaxID=1817910 RepID=A0A1G2DAZ0_9BACT|nr:MAG: hypothetical protein A3D67_01170 [Candidatus Lloydbacteria bacterium RIFCSPHIGHO2_02_FULL_51_22]OGZ15925.1 MAG: hypothetical protein A3G11_02435 [Candidatus Lloydbacteria bacterium RIFCSPLOWO2_12_FULL_51_9]